MRYGTRWWTFTTTALALLWTMAVHAADYLDRGKNLGNINLGSVRGMATTGDSTAVPGYEEGTEEALTGYFSGQDAAGLQEDAFAAVNDGDASAATRLGWDAALQPKREFLATKNCTSTRNTRRESCEKTLRIDYTASECGDDASDSVALESCRVYSGRTYCTSNTMMLYANCGHDTLIMARMQRQYGPPNFYGTVSATGELVTYRGEGDLVCEGRDCTFTFSESEYNDNDYWSGARDLSVSFTLPTEPVDIWSDGCVTHRSDEACRFVSSECTEGTETREVDGTGFERDCWKFEEKYDCYAEGYTPEPLCASHEAEGCELYEEECDAAGCDITYRCPGDLLAKADAIAANTSVGDDVSISGCVMEEVEVAPAVYEAEACLSLRNTHLDSCMETPNVVVTPWCVEGEELGSDTGYRLESHRLDPDYKWTSEVTATCGAGGVVLISAKRWYGKNPVGANGWETHESQTMEGTVQWDGTLTVDSETHIAHPLPYRFECPDETCTIKVPSIDYSHDDKYAGVTFTAPSEPAVDITLVDDCDAFEQEGGCERAESECVEGEETRDISGVSVEQSCWKTEHEYYCRDEGYTKEPYCDDLEARGCMQGDGDCDEDSCQHNYACKVADAVTEQREDCSGQEVTIAGMHFVPPREPSGDFAVAAANLSAVNDAADNIEAGGVNLAECEQSPPGTYACDEGQIKVFTGSDMRCRYDRVGYRDCCDEGWAHDDIEGCNTNEQILVQQRQANVCREIGRYCHRDSDFGCLTYRRTFCCFPSRMGRLLQEQGRVQLGIGWGTPEAPNCRGLTQDELQQIDFSLVDFSEIYADLSGGENVPSEEEAAAIVENYITSQQERGGSQFDGE